MTRDADAAAGAVRIESYVAAYEAGVVDLIVPIQRQEFGIAITAAEQPDLADIPGFYQQGAGAFWVALDGGRVVGTISLKDIGAGAVALRKMFVHADYRGGARGVAASLLRRAIDHARGAGVGTIYLGTTPQFLAAHRFYEKHGFVEIDAAALPPAFPVMAVDKKFYRYDFG